MKKVLFMLFLCSFVSATFVACEEIEPEKEEQKGENKGGEDEDEDAGGTWIDCFYCDDMPDGECSFCQGDGIQGGSKVCDECGGSGICAYCDGKGERYVEW